jgi:cytochrome P450
MSSETTRCPVSHDFDPFGPEFQAAPGMSMATARREQPIFYSSVVDAYVVTRYSDIRAVFTNTEAFSPRNATEPISPLREPALAKLAEHGFKKVKTLGVEEEPVHMRLRKRLTAPFSPDSVKTWEPRVREVMSGYIDAFVRRGHADLVTELITDAPAVVALEFLGVPQEDVEQTKDFAKGIMMFVFGRPSDEQQVATCDFMGQHQKYSKALVERLLTQDRNDGGGFLDHAVRTYKEDPQDLDVDYLAGLAMNGLAAAHETTSNSAANALLLLLSNRASWNEVCADPSVIPGAVDEALRLGPPGATWRRLCVKDTVVGDVEIPAGATVLLVLASGNCDEEAFPEPAAFDIHRANSRRHVTFGIGAHRCLGAGLAQLQMRVMIEELSRRLPHMRLVEGQTYERLPTASVGGPLHLRVEWDPAQNPVPEDRP